MIKRLIILNGLCMLALYCFGVWVGFYAGWQSGMHHKFAECTKAIMD